ncbi:Dedicator of cytokinesis protein 11 [Blattella germanica]|nr:Dedicator of cytokinesis protein 11 [Blattella germanica]
MDTSDCSLFSKECLKSYTSNWNLIHYKYSAYSGTYLELPKILKSDELKDEVYEVDTDADQVDEELLSKNDCITKHGYLMKGPEVGSDRMFVNIGSKSFKRRYCYLRQEVDGTYILELHKDEKKGEAKATIVMDFCTEVVRSSKRGRFCFELRMTAGHKSYSLAAENESELQDWLSKLNSVLQQNRIQEEKRAASLERASNTPPPSPQPLQMYGTLKGLEQSMNPQLIKYARETDVSIALARRENRRRLFSVYPHMPHVKNGSGNSTEHGVDPYREQFGQRFQVICESIRFRLQAPIDGEKEALCQVEPYLTTLALFDAKQGRKLTENFYFDVNHPQVRSMVPSISKNGSEDKPENLLPSELQQVPEEWLIYPKQAVFSISNPHPDIFVVVKIDKILQGSICQTTEPYIRSTKDPRLGLRVHKTVKTCCQRLGNYRMPFAWTARPLFRLYSNELDTSDFPAIYRQEGNRLKDEELLKILTEFRNRFHSLTSSLAPLKPFPLPPTNEPTIELMEFEGTSEKDVHPYTTFINHLYVYPQSLSFDTQKSFTRARNIACIVELRDSDTEGAHPLCCIYGRPGGAIFVHQGSCTVLHHSTIPTWYEEIKIRLPIRLHSKHHLLFTFYHISCELSKKKETTVETCVGYSWLPLLQKGRLNVEEQVLPVASHLPSGYLAVQPLGLGKGYSGPEISWIDGQRQIFSVNFQLVSTVVTRDQHLHNLFAQTEKLLEQKTNSAPPSEVEICKILKAAHAIQLPNAVTFLPTLLNHLFNLLVVTTSEEIGLNVIRVLIHIIHMIHEAGRKEILQAYVKASFMIYFVFVPPTVSSTTTVHEEMSRHLPTLLRPANTDFLVINKFMHHSNFFFEIMVKSMAQHLLSSGRIKMHRNERFSADFLYRIQNLLQVLCPYLIQKYKEMPVETQELNRSLAYFLKFITYHVLSDKLLVIYHFTNYLSEYCLSEEFCKQHFLVGLLLQEVRTSLNEVFQIRKVAISTLRDLLAKHELDDRYQNKGQLGRIAAIYIPWLGIVLDNLNRLNAIHEGSGKHTELHHMYSSSSRFSNSSSFLNLKDSGTSVGTPRSLNRFTMHLDGNSSLVNGSSSVSLESESSTVSGDGHSTVSQETAIIRDPKEEVSKDGSNKRHSRMCLHQFKYTGKRQIVGKTAGKPGTTKAMTLPARMQPPDFSGDSPVLPAHSGSSSVGRDVAENDSSKLYQALLEANMATEVGLIALDALGLYCIHFKDNLLSTEGDNLVMRKVFDIYLSFLQVGQSETLFRHVFAALRAYINNFSVALFQGNASLCGRLCYELLRCCNSRLSTIRQESCAILYLLMRSNFEFTSRKGLTRVHLQVIISVSQMLGNVIGLNNARFQESLSLINSYASSDKVMKGTGFPGEVKDLTKRIRTVLMATAQMREHHHDPEMLVDLQHSLANSYASTPELRHTWLEAMTRNHVRDGNYSEAASCQLHIAALMAEYLKLKNVQTWGAEAFGKISSNIAQDEKGLKLDAGVQDIQYTEYILLEQLEQCAEYMEKAERYELLGDLYRLIIPIHEQKRNYEALAHCYQSLAQAYSKIVEVSRTGKRLLGRFYRVAFFGQAYFEEDSGIEYIYKEPKVTSLSEISERLYNLYCDKFGQEVVKIIMDSVPINPSELDSKYAYIQVTHVTPYFEKLELEERQTEFEQSHDINCFMFETPFTKDGKARGNPEDQWKRRTILTKVLSYHRFSTFIQLMTCEGSVCVQVNAGPLTYASVFLDPSQGNQYSEDKVEDLKDVFREFVKICYTALQINSKLITSDQQEYQEVLRINFQKLCNNLSSLFGESLWPDEEMGCFKRNSQALFSVISGASGNSSSA